MAGNLGRLDPSKNPLCLKLTISPGCSDHLFLNSVVAGDAVNLIPLGLCILIEREGESEGH